MELTHENYYSVEANMEYMSVSQFKDFQKCELYGLKKATGEYVEEKSTALLVGGYMDAHFSNRLEDYKLENPQILKKDGTLKSDYEKANECITVAENDDFFMNEINGEKQVIVTGIINGVKWKGCYDFLNTKIVDMKLVASIRELVWKYDPITKRNYQTDFIDAYGYDTQGAVYQELGRQVFKKEFPFEIAAISKEEQPDKAIIEIDQEYLDKALEEVKELTVRYDMIKKGLVEPNRCGCCPVCRKYNRLDRVVSYKELFNKENDTNE